MPSHSSFWKFTARRRGRQRPDRYSTGSGSDLYCTDGRPTTYLYLSMQASAPPKKIEEKPTAERPAPAQEPSARISMRAVSELEIESVFVSVVIISWSIVPLWA